MIQPEDNVGRGGLCEWLCRWKDSVYLNLMVFFGGKLFEYVDIYNADSDSVVAIILSNDETYINKVSKIQ